MSKYFKDFPKVLYLFGDEVTPVAFQNIGKYSKIIDEVAEQISAYIEYEIKDFERPDSLSQMLYGESIYDWTFFLMNDHIREQGWPKSKQEVYNWGTKKIYKDWVFTPELTFGTADSAALLMQNYPKDQEVNLNGYLLKVKYKDPQTGQIYLYSPNYSEDSDFTNFSGLTYWGENLVADELHPLPGNTQREWTGIYEWRNDSDLPVDYWFETDKSVLTPITNLEKLVEENEKLKYIRVIKASQIKNVTGAFRAQVGI